MRARKLKFGFTLVEVLVVIGIIGVIVGLIMPVIGGVRAESRSTTCLSNLRQIHTALETARQQNGDLLPYAAPVPIPPDLQTPILSAQLDTPGLPGRLKMIMPENSNVWLCPDDPDEGQKNLGTSYLYLPGLMMLFEPPLVDVATHTIEGEVAHQARVTRMVTQRYVNGYMRPYPVVRDFGKYHTHGRRQPRNAAFIDGDARVMKPSDPDID